MSPEVLFILVLLIGIGCIALGKLLKAKIKLLIMLAGILFILFGGFGVFTSLL
ncbi:MAG: hypothetical protein Q4G58_09220 [bacterium]|nr:hypothetical protein [bacterium]